MNLKLRILIVYFILVVGSVQAIAQDNGTSNYDAPILKKESEPAKFETKTGINTSNIGKNIRDSVQKQLDQQHREQNWNDRNNTRRIVRALFYGVIAVFMVISGLIKKYRKGKSGK